MTRVIEVDNAVSVTGHELSIALTAPDRVTFVKATSKEEQKFWMDSLQKYPLQLKVNHTTKTCFY